MEGIDEEAVRRRQRESAVEWAVLFAVAAVIGAVASRRPWPWLLGAAGATALAVLRTWVRTQWLLGRMRGSVALLLHVALAGAGVVGLGALLAVAT